MSRFRSGLRRLDRRRFRRLDRALSRSTIRTVGGRRRPALPNYLGQAFAAFTRAIRAHEKLIKLLPQEFDSRLHQREEAAKVEQSRRSREIELALDKVYGADEPRATPPKETAPPENAFWRRNGAELVNNYDNSGNHTGWRWLTLRQKHRIQDEFLNWELSLQAGRAAFDTFHRLRPNAVLSLRQIARLLDFSSRFGHLAIGPTLVSRRV